MKIAVCIKRVPDMDVRFSIAPDGKSLTPGDLKYDISDFDGYAVEAALQFNEKQGPGEVVVISLGPDAAQETIRKALGMGADRGVLLKCDAPPFDGAAIAQALAAELKDGGYDLILFGRAANDTGNQSVGPMTAHVLGLPCVSAVSKLDIAGGKGSAERQLEGAVESLEFPLPAVVTIDEGVARPRLPSLKGIMAAKKKPLEVKPAQLGSVRLTIEKIELPADRPPGRIIGEGPAAVPELVRLLQDEAKVL
ncbi:MAG TPA: electron transfer flavoprotein subunit beta/FixA family protein [Gemmatimonadales bacterium]|nr:electron transfer flavoprotein subunit beta/FixA family protein [Gemmatimonadales bacterium]